MTQCKIDHGTPLAVPAAMCRVCNPLALAPLTVHVDLKLPGPEYDWREDRLTEADKRAIAELRDTKAQVNKTKAENRIAKMLKRKEAKAIPEGATWDSRRARWVLPQQPCGNSHAKATAKKKRRPIHGK